MLSIDPTSSSFSSSSSSSSSLKRSISTPTTLFSLKTLSLEDPSHNHQIWKHNNGSPIPLNRIINKVNAETFAKQITLIDWLIYSKIKLRNELKPGQWTSTMKYISSPNVVLYTKRFNIITYWVIDEILKLKTYKQRAELISFFIKLINHLIELKNFHSSYAIKSALNSASIHRLEKTWNCLNKKDRQCFEKIDHIFSESENSVILRNFMEKSINNNNHNNHNHSNNNSKYNNNNNNNCIPNLATYLRDIIHIDSAYPQSDIKLSSYRHEKLESIYKFLEKCQQSNYDEIDVNDEIYNYLVSLRYIEELQKFREDNYFNTSLKLEPEPQIVSTESSSKYKKLTSNRFSSHYDIRSLQNNNSSSSDHSINQSTIELNRDYSDLLNKSFQEDSSRRCCSNKNQQQQQQQQQQQHKQDSTADDFKPGHRKTCSLETNLYILNNSQNNSQRNSLTSNKSIKNQLLNNINLIDDSIINDQPIYHVSQINSSQKQRDKKPTLEMFKKRSDDSFWFFDTNEEWNGNVKYEKCTYTDKDIIYKGCINRKTIIKDKKKPPFSFWNNYHLRLTNDSLLFFNNKLCNQETHLMRPCKKFPLLEWSAFELNNPKSSSSYEKQQQTSNIFTLADHTCSTVYKIRTNTEQETKEWLRLIKDTTNRLKQFYI